MAEKVEPLKTNRWLLQKLKERKLIDEGGKAGSPQQFLELIVETTPNKAVEVADDIARLGITVYRGRISFGRFVPIYALVEDIPRIQAIPNVVRVSYSMPRYPYSLPFSTSIVDPLLGEVKVSQVEVPVSLPMMPLSLLTGLATAPFSILRTLNPLTICRLGYEVWPTSETRKLIEAPEDNVIKTKVAVLDTGATPYHILLRKNVDLASTTGEPPFDGLGHGQHCITTAFGDEAPSRFGALKGVAKSLSGTLMSVKCLSNAGFGSSASVLKAMEIAVEWGAQVINMSLGGEMQGGVDEDPECIMVRELTDKYGCIFVVAAGNSGPDIYTIGSPGASPAALTVAAYSPKYKGVADFSSRGPQGGWYRDKPVEFSRDHRRYGEDFLKPDVMAPGGGPVGEKEPVDVIYSGVTGWFDGFYDLTVDTLEAMRGTSMSAPHCSGLVALAYEHGLIRNVADVKAKMRRIWGRAKDVAYGYGLVRWSVFV